VYNGANQPGWNLPGQHALSGFRTRELGEGGGNSAGGRSNHLAMDDTTGEIQVQLKSDHQHSSLSLGSIVRIEDREGRKDARGEGAELRTDGHGVLRAALGWLITTQARLAARGGMKELREALQRLLRARQTHDALADAAQQHNAQDEADQAAVGQAMQRQAREIEGAGERGELTAPHLLIDSAAGIQTSAAGSTWQASGEHHAIASGGHTSIVAGGSLLASAMRTIRMFAQAGMRSIAAAGDIEMQAQAGSVDIRAHDTIRLKARRIELEATEVVLVNGNGSHSRWEGPGIVHGTAGGWTVHAQDRNVTGPISLPVAPLHFPQQLCVECVVSAAKSGSPLSRVQR
nr:DUF2345 domain-containing protein [Burkholderiaceae bacterium]